MTWFDNMSEDASLRERLEEIERGALTLQRSHQYAAKLAEIRNSYESAGNRERVEQLQREISVLFFALMILAPCWLYLWTAHTEYNVPSDPIYMTIGPTETQPGSISRSYFRFIAYLDDNRIGVYGSLYSASDSAR